MPYYCTVPRCTSMAGKVKNVSFHQFPRDEELAKLWNNILKRGKPYTKYSKVCSLHFTPDDYTITNAGKYKGQWRTLRKDAIPSRNLPTEPPVPYQRRDSTSWSPVTTAVDPRLHQQMAQAIYVQTMLAMQAAGVADTTILNHDQQISPNRDRSITPSSIGSEQISFNYDHYDKVIHQGSNTRADNITDSNSDNTDIDNTENRDVEPNFNVAGNINTSFVNRTKKTYKCNECSKCFKDPDVFFLHKRIHTKSPLKSVENENLDANSSVENQETLKANPILANLLKSGVPQGPDLGPNDLDVTKALDSNVVSIESQIMTALAANMENYLRNLSTIMTNSALVNSRNTTESTEVAEIVEEEPNNHVNNGQVAEIVGDKTNDCVDVDNGPNSDEVGENKDTCDRKDFDDSQDSAKLVIDEEEC